MKLKEYIVRKLINNKLLDQLFLERISFLDTIDIDKFERDAIDIWSSVGHTHKFLREWIEMRKAMILRQNMLEPDNGLRMVLLEWETVEQFIGSPVIIPQLPQGQDTSPELKTQEQIITAYRSRNNKDNVL